MYRFEAKEAGSELNGKLTSSQVVLLLKGFWAGAEVPAMPAATVAAVTVPRNRRLPFEERVRFISASVCE